MKRSGFTLTELLVTVAIALVLMSVLLVSLAPSRQSGYQVKCSANERGVAQSTQLYVNDYRILPAINQLDLPDDSSRCPANKSQENLPSYLFPASPIFVNTAVNDPLTVARYLARAYENSPNLTLIQDANGYHFGKTNYCDYNGSVTLKEANFHSVVIGGN